MLVVATPHVAVLSMVANRASSATLFSGTTVGIPRRVCSQFPAVARKGAELEVTVRRGVDEVFNAAGFR